MVEVVVPQAPRGERMIREEMRVATRERWREWQRLLDEQVYESRAALARGEGVSRAAVTQGLAKWTESR